MNVANVMVKDVVTCAADSNLNDVALTMWNTDCGSVPVVNAKRHPVGIVTDRDIAMAAVLKHQPLWNIRAQDISSDKPVYSCGESDDISVALEQMQEHQVRRLLVTNERGELTGIVSMGDVVAQTGTGKDKISYESAASFFKAVSAHHGGLPIAV